MSRASDFWHRLFCAHDWVLIDQHQAPGRPLRVSTRFTTIVSLPQTLQVREFRCAKCGKIKVQCRSDSQ